MNTNAALVVPAPPQGGMAFDTNDIRALKGPVDLPLDWTTYLWIAILVLIAAASVVWNRFIRNLCRRLFARYFAKPAPRPVPPHVRARQRLQAALSHISDPRGFCFEVSETLRVYLEERFNLRAPEQTTEEFLVELQTSYALSAEQKKSLADFLQSCDLVKFARFEPTETALRDLHESALRLVDETQFEPVGVADAAQPALAAR